MTDDFSDAQKIEDLSPAIRERAALADAHDARVGELLAANNAEVERRREAETRMAAIAALVREMRPRIAEAAGLMGRTKAGKELREQISMLGVLLAMRMPDVIADVVAERTRQISVEGWTPEHDDAHTDGQLAQAAACYANEAARADRTDPRRDGAPPSWPWSRDQWKPKDRRHDLVRAGALIIAEIERLDRQFIDLPF